MSVTSGIKRVRIDDDNNTGGSDVAMTSQSVNVKANMASEETPITWAPEIETPGFDFTKTVRLNCNFSFTIKNKTQGARVSFYLRPTSLYNICDATTTSYATAATNGFSYQNRSGRDLTYGWDSVNEIRPGWLSYYEQLYDKYHVISCDYSVKCKQSYALNDNSFYVYLLETGENNPPGMSREDLIDMPPSECQVKKLTSALGNDTAQRMIELKGTYRPGDFGEDVITDTLSERWTSTNIGGGGNNPTYQERLYVAVDPADELDQYPATGPDLQFNISMSFVVQFKGLKEKFKYPTAAATLWDTSNWEMYGRYP